MRFVKNTEEINIMKDLGKTLGGMLDELYKAIGDGTDSWDLEDSFIDLCKKNKVRPVCKGYAPEGMTPFPTGLCLSINSQSVHCYPKKGVIIKDGDIVTVDTVIGAKSLNVDSSFCKLVGSSSDSVKKKLYETSCTALYSSIKVIKNGVRVGQISNRMQKVVESRGLNVLKDYAGHGIGTDMHEYPEIPCFGPPDSGAKLISGMTVCVESLICTGKSDVVNTSLWETRMADGGFFGQFEHTVLVTEEGYEILTLNSIKI